METYTTPKGTTYGIGSIYTDNVDYPPHSVEYTIDNIIGHVLHLSWVSKRLSCKDVGEIMMGPFEERLDLGTIRLVNEYKFVDPTTIKFDFRNTKIAVGNDQEALWVESVANVNDCRWTGNGEKKYVKDLPNHIGFLYFDENNIISQTPKHTVDYFNSNSATKITIQDILNSQKMKDQEIEVGDTIQHTAYTEGSNEGIYVVSAIRNGRAFYVEGGQDSEDAMRKNYRIVKKANKQEIIGYELLKDLPGIPAGTKSSKDGGYGYNFSNEKVGITIHDLSDTTWFKPLYKVKEVKVKISNNSRGSRSVTIYQDKIVVSFNDLTGISGRTITLEEFTKLHQMMFPIKMLETHVGSLMITFPTVTIGCQEFTQEDVRAVNKAIESLK